MKIEALDIEGVLLIEPKRVYGAGGFSCESYSAGQLASRGVNSAFVTEYTAFKAVSGTVAGLHYQQPPFAQAMLIRAVRGAIFAAALDLRKGSVSFGKAVGAELNAENNRQLYAPEGFALGYATLRPLTEIQRKSSKPASSAHLGGVYWDDPALRINWPVTAEEAILSAEDSAWPLLRDLVTPFTAEANEEDAAA